MNQPAATAAVPDLQGRFGEFGRRYVPETLMHALEQLTEEYEKARRDEYCKHPPRDLAIPVRPGPMSRRIVR